MLNVLFIINSYIYYINYAFIPKNFAILIFSVDKTYE